MALKSSFVKFQMLKREIKENIEKTLQNTKYRISSLEYSCHNAQSTQNLPATVAKN